MARRHPNTSIYRQQDTSVLKNIPLPVNPQVTAVTPSGTGTNYAWVYFDQPITLAEGLGLPAWTIGVRTITLVTQFSSDFKACEIQLSGNIALDDAISFPAAAPGEEHFVGIAGGDLVAYTGALVAAATPNTFSVLSVAPDPDSPTDTVLITFDAPVACVCSATITGGGVNLNLTNWILSSTHLASIDHVVSPSVISCGVSGAYTSGTSFAFPGGVSDFVSITGSRLNAATGTVDPA
jgi:hypothetical protein